MGDQTQAVIFGATDEVLAILKADDLNDNDRKNEIESLFSSKLTDEMFNSLTVMAKELTDYQPDAA